MIQPQDVQNCAGVLSWEIEGSGQKVVLMYSIPYSHDFHSNWIAVGLCSTSSRLTFDEMYRGNEDSFKRKDFYYETNPVNYQNSKFAVTGTCGTSHKPTIIIKLAPFQNENLHARFK